MHRYFLHLLVALLILIAGSSALAAYGRHTAPIHKYVFKVYGMTCSICKTKVRKMLFKFKGTKSVFVNLKNNTVTVYTKQGFCFSKKKLHHKFAQQGFNLKYTMIRPRYCR